MVFPPNNAQAAPWSFAVLGDQQSDSDNIVNTNIVPKMATQIFTYNPSFALCFGDLVTGVRPSYSVLTPLPAQYAIWKTNMAPLLAPGAGNPVPVNTIRGNHEVYDNGDTGVNSSIPAYSNALGNALPQNGPDDQKGLTYSFRNNNVFLIGLDENYSPQGGMAPDPAGNKDISPLVNQSWLNSQLNTNTDCPFTIVYGHYPAFPLSQQNLDPNLKEDGSLADNPAARNAFWQSLLDRLKNTNSIPIYFGAHMHVYNRATASINGGANPLMQIIMGGGGADLSNWDGTYPENNNSQYKITLVSHQEKYYGYAVFTVDNNTLNFNYYYNPDSQGNNWMLFDSFSLVNQGYDNKDLTSAPGSLNSNIIYYKTGTGKWLITGGLNNVTAQIIHTNGTFIINGDLPNITLTTFTDTLTQGSGSIGSTTNYGNINPGNSPGTLTVVGSYVQGSTGTLTAEIASASSYDHLNVTGAPGTASLAGAIAPILYGGFKPRGNQVFPGVITASGGVTGTFDTILNQQITPTLFWQARYNPNSVDLWVQRNYTNTSLTLNSNQQAVGAMLNGVAGVTGGDLDNVLNNIDYLPDSTSVREAFKQISPEKAGSLTSLGFAAATFQMRHLAIRTTNQRFVQGESGGSLTGGGLGFNYSKQEGLMLAYNGATLSDLFSPRKAFHAPDSRWGLFADGGAAWGRQGSSVNQTGYSFTLGGMTLGADYRLRDNLIVGLATGYSNTSASFSGSGGGVNTNTIPVNAYAAYFPGSLYAYGSLGYALNLYDLNRGLTFGGLGRTASSSTSGHQLNLYGETGYDLKLSRFILTPSATLAYSGLWVGGFTEQGAGALNLKAGAQSATSMQTGLGGRVTVPLKVGSVNVAPQAYAFYQHEFANGSRNLNASLSQGSSPLTFQTDASKRNFALVGASLTAGLAKNLYGQVNYSAEVGRVGSSAQSINAGLRYEF